MSVVDGGTSFGANEKPRLKNRVKIVTGVVIDSARNGSYFKQDSAKWKYCCE
jgi:hypothetical protein